MEERILTDSLVIWTVETLVTTDTASQFVGIPRHTVDNVARRLAGNKQCDHQTSAS